MGLIVTGMILCELFSAVTLLLLARRHLNRAGGLTGAPLEHRQLNRRIASIAVPIGLTSLLGNLMGSATSVLIPSGWSTRGGGLGGHERLRRAVRHDTAHALPAHRLHRGAGPGAGAQAG